MIDHVAELMDAGLDSLKIEGRAKSAYYAAVVTGAYRHAIDAAAAGRAAGPGVAGRGGARSATGTTPPASIYGQPGQYTETARYIRDWQVRGRW